MTIALTPSAPAEPTPYLQLTGHGFGILLPDCTLYRTPAAHEADPEGTTPMVWLESGQAEAVRADIAAMLRTLFGLGYVVADLRVVRLERGADGAWRLPTPAPLAERFHRPIDPDTRRPSAWPCASTETLSVADAHQVMREHRECAGPITCRIRGRARAILARAGVMRLVSPARAANVWLSLRYPDTATPWRGW